METVIGIDLGTTFCAVATVDASGKAVILKNSLGESLTPSVIWFKDTTPVVGIEAKQMQELGEHEVASFFKRDMGNANFSLNFNDKDYSARDLSAILLKKLKEDAELSLGKSVQKAVITVPAYFNNLQREATIRAGKDAGLEVLRIINEPTAAAIAFGLNTQYNGQTVLVYDLGGGTFDVTIIKINADTIEVLGTDGDHELGGKNWDDRIITYAAQQFEEEFSLDILADSVAFNDLLVRAENAKKQLSVRDSTRLAIAFEGQKGKYDIDIVTFENLTRDLLERTQSLTEKLMADVHLSWQNINGVLLVGGSTRMPMVTRWIAKMSGKTPLRGVNVDEAVALGAAIQAHLDAHGHLPMQDRFALGGSRKILDVMSHSLGLVAENQDRTKYINSIIIPKNKHIPSKEAHPYQARTRPGNNNSMDVYMVQGESERPSDCHIIGKYVFSNIEHQQGGQAVLDVTYAYDTNGVINVLGHQRSTGKLLDCQVEKVPEDMSWLDFPPKDEVQVVHLSVIVAIDLSGSMSGQPLRQAKEAAHEFIKKLDLTSTSIGLLLFADSVKVSQALCQNALSLEKGINAWAIGEVGYGNATQPFTEALKSLAAREDPRFLIVLTDGVWSDQALAIKEAQLCKKEGIEIIAIGFDGADKQFLQKIATSDANALHTNAGNLTASFSKIAQVLTETGGAALGETTHKSRGFFSR